MNSLKVQNLFKELEKLEGISDIIGTALVNRNGDFQLIIMGADDQLILVSLLNLNTNLGLLFIEIEETIKNVKKILDR